MYNIGQISELTGYSQRMIRYFEEQGLIRPPRAESGYRKFENDHVAIVLKIKKLRELGFSFQEIRDLLNLNDLEFQTHALKLLKRHHQAADDLLEKIQRLEKICHGEARTKSVSSLGQGITTFSSPERTAYRIKTLERVSELFQVSNNDCKSEIIFWKLGDFIENCDLDFSDFDLYEIYSQSALVTILKGSCFLPAYLESWVKAGHAMDAIHKGSFPRDELGEFFGKHEVVIDHRFLDSAGKVLFRIILPYQAIFLKTS